MHEQFLADITDHPGDDTPRLVYADWLDEHGEPERAEFIRVQCELAAMDERGEGEIDPQEGHTCWQSPCPVCALVDKYQGLCRREEALLDEHWAAWVHAVFDPFAYDVGVATDGTGTQFKVALYDRGAGEQGHWECEFRRGFVAAVTLTLADWLAHGPSLVRAAPLEEVRLSDRRPQTYHNDPTLSEYPGPSFGWWRTRDGRCDLEYGLSPQLWELLPHPQGRENNRDWADYHDKQAARRALSDACLAWAKRRVPALGAAR